MRAFPAVLISAVIIVAGVGCGRSSRGSTARHSAPQASTVPTVTAATVARRGAPTPARRHAHAAAPASTDPKPAQPRHRLPLEGKVVGIDPGHNGLNYTDPSFLAHLIWNGREQETCDTTGTETDGGYTEPRFNFNVATYLASDLRAEGAKVVLTRTSDAGVGPCVTARAQIINRAHADVAIDIHADGGPAGGRGFTVLEPVADGPNDRVIAASRAFGRDLLAGYRAMTGMPLSTYDGVGGVAPRDDLAGLNLTTVPKVLIECGNMRNAADASLLVSTSFQKLAAKAFAQAIARYLGP
ncbi:MAG TPA: N-acetylmuramoyl-L-alanine amidase [Solirubrobacteraceae bacterium]|nr:N-acetylmuramoyl-L-alanine amidase [Solirubrobacteraceae bacterium]